MALLDVQVCPVSQRPDILSSSYVVRGPHKYSALLITEIYVHVCQDTQSVLTFQSPNLGWPSLASGDKWALYGPLQLDYVLPTNLMCPWSVYSLTVLLTRSAVSLHALGYIEPKGVYLEADLLQQLQ